MTFEQAGKLFKDARVPENVQAFAAQSVAVSQEATPRGFCFVPRFGGNTWQAIGHLGVYFLIHDAAAFWSLRSGQILTSCGSVIS